jgi:peptidoglycan/LPS O-acetylase OafA/YrhL
MERIAGLDAWRSLLMLGGLFVHASAWLEPTPMFFAVTLVSQAFRMGIFFALSGLLAAKALQRTATGIWLSRRLRQLGIPAMTGVLVLSPLVWWLAVSRPPELPGEPPVLFAWLHIWFLWGLLLCSAALSILDRRDPHRRLVAFVEARLSPAALILATAVATGVMFAVVPPLLLATMPPRLVDAYANLQLIAGYLPTFLYGVIVARSDLIRGRLVAAWPTAAVMVFAVLTVHLLLCAGELSAWEPEIRFIGAAIGPPAAFVLVLRSALHIERIPRFVQSLSEASYSIFLLHVPVCVAINTRMAPLALGPNLQYGFTIMLAGTSCWLFHIGVVRRSRTLSFLLNGRTSQRLESPIAVTLVVQEEFHCPHGVGGLVGEDLAGRDDCVGLLRPR